MYELGMIAPKAYQEALRTAPDFKQGQVGYQLDYVMEIVKDAVSSDEVLAELARHGVDNISTSGVRIVTTVDKEVRDRTVYALRHDLSRLDTELRGYEREQVQTEYAVSPFPGDGRLEPGAFLFGTVTEVGGSGKDLRIKVDFGDRLGHGVIASQGLQRLALARTKWRRNVWAKAGAKERQALADQIVAGDRIWVSVTEVGEDGLARLELEKYPAIEGGAIVVKNGAILAMAGGVENRFFNRAVQARRTMGSSFKPFVYAAALQLGWNSTDLLKNSRDVFVYQKQPYFPRPDHKSPFSAVSMSWAGTKSENLASVWLVAHLCDYLSPVQFEEVARHVGLAPGIVDGQRESYQMYRQRIRDEFGILISSDTMKESAFKAAVRNSETDFMFENLVLDYRFFKSINYGLGLGRYRTSIDREYASLSGGNASERAELQKRRRLLSSINYLSLNSARQKLRDLSQAVENTPFDFGYGNQPTDGSGSDGLYYEAGQGVYSFYPNGTGNANLQFVHRRQLVGELYGLSIAERKRFWDKVQLYGVVSVAGVDLLAEQIGLEYRKLQEELPYSFAVLADVDDFRILVGLRYLIALAREMGIASGMQPVLSFPLGSNVVSLLETTRMYEGLVTGKVTTYGAEPDTTDRDSLLVIDRIESADGEVLYRPTRQVRTVLGDKARLAVGHILENVVNFGTGRQAGKEVRLAAPGQGELFVPLLGKTGTANDYTNAAFFGYLPGLEPDGSGLNLHDGYAVGVYVGYDDNGSMRKSSIRISGSAGALPTWIDIVNSLIRKEDYAGKLSGVEAGHLIPLKRDDRGQIDLAVDPGQGGRVTGLARAGQVDNRGQMTILTFGSLSGGRYIPERSYQPFWRVGQ
ncbi:MAG: penicillin-binding transpeptidase domain-containing protein [Desulfopila sp.]